MILEVRFKDDSIRFIQVADFSVDMDTHSITAIPDKGEVLNFTPADSGYSLILHSDDKKTMLTRVDLYAEDMNRHTLGIDNV